MTITQRELLFLDTENGKKKAYNKAYYLLAGMVAEMERDDPRRGLARKLMSEYAEHEKQA